MFYTLFSLNSVQYSKLPTLLIKKEQGFVRFYAMGEGEGVCMSSSDTWHPVGVV